GWVKGTADRITFTVTDVAPATSTITINGAKYLSGNDYEIASTDTLTIVVTTEEADKVTAVRTFTVPVTHKFLATAPSNIELTAGSVNPVGGVTNVAIPNPGATDTNGSVTGWVKGTADRITFTVTDVAPATSTITINGAKYLSGNDYEIASTDTLTIVVTTEEADKVTAVRTFTVPVAQAIATAPSNIELTAGSVNPVGGVTNVAIPDPEATDTTGKVTGWVKGTADRITFTVTDVAPATSTITINGADYTSGQELQITSAGTLTIIVTTEEAGKVTAVRTFKVDVTS
ncbi:MAG: hypothetical protein ACOX8V_05995, partial [Thermoleophilia bacterium]